MKAPTLTGVLGVVLACLTPTSCSSSGGSTPCTELTACCATLFGAEAMACTATASTKGVTDAECTQALTSYRSAGSCNGGDSGVRKDGGPVTGCAALMACCPELPASDDPASCLTVVSEGTAQACTESLAMYQAGGHCGSAACPGSKPETVTYHASGSCGSAGDVTLSVAKANGCALELAGPTSVALPKTGTFSGAAAETKYDIAKGSWTLGSTAGSSGLDCQAGTPSATGQLGLTCNTMTCTKGAASMPATCEVSGTCVEQLTPAH